MKYCRRTRNSEDIEKYVLSTQDGNFVGKRTVSQRAYRRKTICGRRRVRRRTDKRKTMKYCSVCKRHKCCGPAETRTVPVEFKVNVKLNVKLKVNVKGERAGRVQGKCEAACKGKGKCDGTCEAKGKRKGVCKNKGKV